MSSLPPYNPRVGDRAVWLFPVRSLTDLPATWEGPWAAAAVEDPDLVGPVGALCGLDHVATLDGSGHVTAPDTGWMLVVASPALSEEVLRDLMGMPMGTARFVMEAGARSVVQLLPDRAVLLRLNEGRAVGGG